MESQNNTYSAKSPKAGKIVVIVIAACAVITAAIFLIINLSISPAEKTARAFMEAFVNGDHHEMSVQSDIHAFDDEVFGVYSYIGTKVFDYNITAISKPSKVRDRLIAERSEDDTDEDFQDEKELTDLEALSCTDKYGVEYVVVENSANRYVLESTSAVLDEYTLILDVQYTTSSGVVMRNDVSMTVCQQFINSDIYKVTRLSGILH